jgi:hypothetical protein
MAYVLILAGPERAKSPLNNPHFILDYETMGQDVFKVPVINCSYFIFDWARFTSDEPYTFNELIKSIKFDKMQVEPQVKAGCSFNKRDLQWWMDQGEEAQKQIKPSAQDIPVSKFVENLYTYVKGTKIKRWWSRSNTFDPLLLARNFMDHPLMDRDEMHEILPYWLVRDIRTYIDTQFNFTPPRNDFCPIDDEALWEQYFVKHNSVHDVAADILRLQKIDRTVNG